MEIWLSPARYRVYLTEAEGDREHALEPYQLRNAYVAPLDAGWRGVGHWLDDPASPLRVQMLRSKKGGRRGRRRIDVNEGLRKAIDTARTRHRPHAPPGKIIAELPLGVWRYLSSSAHEKTLWVPYLHETFPSGVSRARVDKAIGNLHELRNRAAHWEPLLATPLKRRMEELVWIAGLLSADLAAYIRCHSQVERLLDQWP